MSKQDPIWTVERITLLSRMWSEGCSSGAIAKVLGVVSRNAVMGKIDRMGLMGAKGSLAKAAGGAEAAKRPAPAPRIQVTQPVMAVRAAKAPPVRPARAKPVPPHAPVAATAPGIDPARQAAREANLALLRGYAALATAPLAWAAGKTPVTARVEPAPAEPVVEPPIPPAPDLAAEVPALPGSSVPAPSAEAVEARRLENERISAARLVALTAAGERRRQRADAAAAERALQRQEREMSAPDEDEALAWMPPAAPDERVTVMRLRSHMCRWPFGDPDKPGFHFCGVNAIEGKPYCAEHAEIAYQAPAPRTNRASTGWTPERIFKARQMAVTRMQNKRPGRRSQKFSPATAE